MKTIYKDNEFDKFLLLKHGKCIEIIENEINKKII